MSRRANRYAELSGRIASAARFCEFLDAGGKVLDHANDQEWRDVTADVLSKERNKVRELERIRNLFYADMASEEEPAAPIFH